jgi:hypothetical protein
LFNVPVEYQLDSQGTLEWIGFSTPLDCRGNPARVAIPRWWKEGACGAVLASRQPTYDEGAPPVRKSASFVYDQDRPNVVRPQGESTREIVVDDSLDQLPTRGDTSRVCDGDFTAPPPVAAPAPIAAPAPVAAP